jgi:ElaB/YqjD/DUF883 family membrane-anchored ribosome-binding protein
LGSSNGKGFGMADDNKSTGAGATNGTNTGGEDVTFAADPKLGADAGTTTGAIEFDAAEDLTQSESRRSTAQTLKDEAGKFGTQAADRMRAFAGDNKDRATGALDEFAQMMRGAADDVDAKLGAEFGKYARSAADGISGFAENLRGKEVDELLDQASDLVRKSPAIAVGTAAAVGFVLARLVKSGIDAASEPGDRPGGGAGSTTA